MKIIAIDNNYDAQGTPVQAETTVLADSAVLQGGNPFFIPDMEGEFALYPSLAIKISRLGKRIAPRFVSRYWQQAAIGFNARCESMLRQMRAEGRSWSRAVSFDGSVILGKFATAPDNLSFSVNVDGNEAFVWDPALLMSSIDEAIAMVSRYDTLKTGDILLIGLPTSGIPLEVNHRITASGGDCGLPAVAFNIK